MKLFAPKYYKDFVCIADRCRHSCCIGWEIDVDTLTAKKYESMKAPYADEIRRSIDPFPVPHFILASNERCPHLNASGLCNIILNLGEDCLCDICREHPRFYNDSSLGKEVGLGMVCEEACRIILTSDSYTDIIEIGEMECDAENTELDTVRLREHIYNILSDKALPYPEKLDRIYEDFGVSPSILDDSQWQSLLASLEYLDVSHRELFLSYSSEPSTPKSYEKVLERALAYFVFRHCTEAYDENDYRTSLGMCLFFERLLASVLKSEHAKNENDCFAFAQAISEELEYSEDNTDAIRSEFMFGLNSGEKL